MSVSTGHEVGVVTELRPNGKALVKIRRAEACHSCASVGACNALGGKIEDVFLEVDNHLNASPGDQVALSMSEGNIVKASAVLYLIPALLLMAGAGLGHWYASANGMNADPSALGGAALGFGLGLLTSRVLGSILGKDASYTPRLTNIVDRVGP